jgi:hypothetical protein
MLPFLKRYSATTSYDDPSTSDDGEKPWLLEIDEISVARQLKLEELPQSFFPWLDPAVELTRSTEAFVALFLEGSHPAIIWGQKTRAEYREHIACLVKAKVIARIPKGKAKFLSRYFAIPKKDGKARAIWNGRTLSNMQRVPEPVNLPEIPEVLRVAWSIHQSMCAREPRTLPAPSVLAYDFRHWFHQIGVSLNIGTFFAIACAGEFYAWLGLPMGWSWSPRIAQCISWSIVLTCGAACIKHEADQARKSLHPPAFIHTRREDGTITGIIFIWYDNIVALIWDHQHFGEFQRSLDARCEVVNAALSAREAWSSVRIQNVMAPAFPSFLGAEITCQPSVVEGKTVSFFGWRTEHRLRQKASDLAKKLEQCQTEDAPTHRDVARAVGYILWNAYMRDQPLLQEADTIQIQHHSKHVRGKMPR